MGSPFNVPILIAILLFYSAVGSASFIPPTTATIIGTFSIVYPESSTTSSSGSSNPPIQPTTSIISSSSVQSTPLSNPTVQPTDMTSTISLTIPNVPPTALPENSPPSEFMILLNNPVVVASLIILIIAATILIAVLCRVRHNRRRWQAPDLAPPPDAYAMTSRASLSIKNVAISPLGSPSPSPTPPPPAPILIRPPPRRVFLIPPPQPRRTPSPAPSAFSHAPSAFSHASSSDIHDVQRELHGRFSFVPGPLRRSSRSSFGAASRSSLGTTAPTSKTRPPSAVQTRPTSAEHVWSAERAARDGRRQAVRWDVEAALISLIGRGDRTSIAEPDRTSITELET
ncbi:hypothetical protein C8R44DRAFT_873372 [Mycena epipterygia]|nr:hypothetical protein C8R44DRAFT_873372 [Mycena epipterygia]